MEVARVAHHDFDADPRFASQSSFTMRGYEFHIVDDVDPAVFFQYDELSKDTPSERALEIMDSLICDCLAPADGVMYRAMRADHKIGFKRIQALSEFLVGVMSGKSDPPQPTSRSDTPARGGASSTGTSPSAAGMRVVSTPGG